jgi:hypothetical protein
MLRISITFVLFQLGIAGTALAEEVMLDEFIAKCIRCSEEGRPLRDTGTNPVASHFTNGEFTLVLAHIEKLKPEQAFHLMMLLRTESPSLYSRLSKERKAEILFEALRRAEWFNDWGNFEKSFAFDDVAILAAMECDDAATKAFLSALDDHTEAPHYGSDAATFASRYQYRRCDYAFRILCLIHNKPFYFDKDPVNRDHEIESVKKLIEANSKAARQTESKAM